MYLVAKESDNILVYGYKHMTMHSNTFQVDLSFEEFSEEMNFKFTKEDFTKSLTYLINTNKIDINPSPAKSKRNEFLFSIKVNVFPYIESIILTQEHPD